MTPTEPAPDHVPTEADVRLVDSLAQVSFVVQRVLTEVATAHDLSLTQLRLLAIVQDRAVAMADLAERLGLDRSSVSGLVDRAQGRGLVRREPRPEDGRGIRVHTTGAGAQLATEVRAAVTARVLDLAGPLSVRERARLTDLAGRVARIR